MIEKIKSILKRRKVKLFFVFLLSSFFAWFLSNLSKSYTSNATFDLNFIGVSEDKMLISASKEEVDVKLEAVGFQFLLFNFNNKTVDIDLSEVQKVKGKYVILPNQYQKQIEKQLSNSMQLLQKVDDTIFFNFQEVSSKKLLVEPVIEMNFEPNYILDGVLEVEPLTISVTGPAEELDNVLALKTIKIELDDLASDFSQTVSIVVPVSMKSSSFSTEKVTVSGKVSRFSEKIIEVPVKVVNLPENISIRTFPDKIKVLCKAKMSNLKNLTSTDFIVVADYNEVAQENSNSNKLTLSLLKVPKNVFNASLGQKQVEYILRNK